MARLAEMLLDESQHTVTNLAAIIYNISEQENFNKELNKEPLDNLR